MKILIAGGDGYCGWPTALYLSKIGHEVTIIDNLLRRKIDDELKSNSLTPIASLENRVAKWKELTGIEVNTYLGDLNSYDFLREVLRQTLPDVFVHLAEQRSDSYSMIDREHAIFTQTNNVMGTLNVIYALREMCPNCHLIKLGIGFEPMRSLDDAHIVNSPDPVHLGSMAQLSKFHDRHNLMFASIAWGIRSTELRSSHIYGLHTDETLMDPLLVNRFDYDAFFGSVLHRFLIQAAVRHPLTVYGTGAHTYGLFNIRDIIRSIEFAIRNPAESGEYKAINLRAELFSEGALAQMVQRVAEAADLEVTIDFFKDLRLENEASAPQLLSADLSDLDLLTHPLTDEVLKSLLKSIIDYKDRAKIPNILPHAVR